MIFSKLQYRHSPTLLIKTPNKNGGRWDARLCSGHKFIRRSHKCQEGFTKRRWKEAVDADEQHHEGGSSESQTALLPAQVGLCFGLLPSHSRFFSFYIFWIFYYIHIIKSMTFLLTIYIFELYIRYSPLGYFSNLKINYI